MAMNHRKANHLASNSNVVDGRPHHCEDTAKSQQRSVADEPQPMESGFRPIFQLDKSSETHPFLRPGNGFVHDFAIESNETEKQVKMIVHHFTKLQHPTYSCFKLSRSTGQWVGEPHWSMAQTASRAKVCDHSALKLVILSHIHLWGNESSESGNNSLSGLSVVEYLSKSQ